MFRALLATCGLVALGCRGGEHPRTPARAPTNQPGPAAPTPAPAAPSGRSDPAEQRCYPYLAAPDGPCPTSCQHRDDCAGSRGPGDFAEHGWPLDCIGGACVPLPPEHVHPP